MAANLLYNDPEPERACVMTQVFISYSRKDLIFVERLAEDLQAAGLEVWYDLSGLEGGTRWGQEIQSAIEASQVFVVVLSPNSIDSQWVEREFMYAESMKKKIIPLLYQPCKTPMWFINLHFIDVQGENYDRNFWVMLKAMGGRVGEGKAKTRPASAAPAINPPPAIPSLLPQEKQPEKKASLPAPKLRPAWIIGLVGLAALVGFAVWGMPALAARLAPIPTSTPTVTYASTPVPTHTPTSTPTQTLVPSPTFTPMPTLNPTTGTVTGSVGWGNQPVKDAVVTLCTNWSSTCKGTKFTGVTDANGHFTISGVTPGDYQLTTKYPGQTDETRQVGQGGWPVSIQVTAGQRVTADPVSICKNDLELYFPTIKGNTVTFVWKPYPDATTYTGRVTGQGGWDTTSTLYTMNLQSGNYQLFLEMWTATNKGCVRGYVNFTVP